MARSRRLGKVPEPDYALSEQTQARAKAVRARIQAADAELMAAHKRLWDLPSALPQFRGMTIREAATEGVRNARGVEKFSGLTAEGGVYTSNRRYLSAEGVAQLEGFADAVSNSAGAIDAEGRRAKSRFQKIAYQAARGGTSPRGTELAQALAALGPQAAYVLDRTGFMDRLRSLGNSEQRRYADTDRLVELIDSAESGQWESVVAEARNASQYNVSKIGKL